MSGPLKLRLGTYNIGVPFDDYQSMLRTIDLEAATELQQKVDSLQTEEFKQLAKSFESLSSTEQRPIRAKLGEMQRSYELRVADEVESHYAEKLSSELDVICLQEVKNTQRAFITTLVKNGFDIIKGDKSENFDTAIAVRRGTYTDLTDFSKLTVLQKTNRPCGEDLAGVTLTLPGGTTIAIGSLHTPGFELYQPGTPPIARDQIEEKQVADAYVRTALNTLNSQKADIKLMAGDMNNNPDNHTPQFKLIQRMDFQYKQPTKATNWNGFSDYSERVLDFIFLGQPSFFKNVCTRVKSIFFSTLICKTTKPEVMKGYSFKPIQTCSDHLPVATIFIIYNQPSLITRVWQSVTNLLKR